MSLLDFQKAMHDGLVELNKQTGDIILTGEKNLDISKEELTERIMKNVHGNDYLDVLEYENSILERQGLIKGRIDLETFKCYFNIPDWDKFISAVNAFYVSYQPCENEE